MSFAFIIWLQILSRMWQPSVFCFFFFFFFFFVCVCVCVCVCDIMQGQDAVSDILDFIALYICRDIFRN